MKMACNMSAFPHVSQNKAKSFAMLFKDFLFFL